LLSFSSGIVTYSTRFFDAISEICGAKIGAKQQKINRSAENVALLRAI
jgi:hypothetical protein